MVSPNGISSASTHPLLQASAKFLGDTLKKYVGKEDELWAKLKKKYEPAQGAAMVLRMRSGAANAW